MLLPAVTAGRSRWLIRLGIVLLLALGALLWVFVVRRPTLEIENRSEQSVATLTITIGGQIHTFENVPAGGRMAVSSPNRSEERFTIQGRLADKTRIFATGRIGDDMQFLLLPGGQLEPRRKRS